MSTVALVVILLLRNCFGSSALQLNQILNIFENCYTDLICANSSVPDISPTTYPLLISTPQMKYSFTPSTIQVDFLTTMTMHIDDELPQITSYVGFSPHAIKLRFNCVALVILGAKSIDHIRQSIRFRHHRLHYTKYVHRRDGENITDEVFYTGPLYINLINTEEHRAIWFPSPTMTELPAVFMWKVRTINKALVELELKITVNPPCGIIFNEKVNSASLTRSILDRIFISGITLQCSGLIFTGCLRSEIGIGGDVDKHFMYFGPPFEFKTLAYPSDPYQQLMHKHAIFNILGSVFTNSTIYLGRDLTLGSRIQEYSRRFYLNGWIKNLSPGAIRETLVVLFGETWNIRPQSPTRLYLPTRISDFRFMACELRVFSIDFQEYMKPFGVNVWLYLGIVLGSSTMFLFVVFQLNNIRVNGFLLLYSFLLEHGHHIGARLRKIRSFNTFMTTFLMMAIILQNGYKGIVISDITAPLQENLICTYEEASKANYTILAPNTLSQISWSNYFIARYRKGGYNE